MTTSPLASRLAIAALTAASLLCFLLAHAAAARADATITVHTTQDTTENGCTPTTGICSLREAIELANDGSVSGAVTIDFTVSGEIETGPRGPLEIEPNASVSALTIQGPGASNLTLNGNDESEVFFVHHGDVTISGLTVTDGYATWEGGGALYQDGGSVVLADMVLTANSAEDALNGGAIYQNNGNLLISNSVLSDNKAFSGIGGGHGGAIYEDTNSTGTLTLEGTKVTGNKSEGDGGGIYEDEGQLTVTQDSVIGNNEAEGTGGGIYAEGSGSQARVLVTGGSEVSENKAEKAGGIYGFVGGRGLIVSSASVLANTATDVGGGIFVTDEATVLNSLVAHNFSEADSEEGGGGIFASSADEVQVETSTIADNSGGGIFNDKTTLVVRNSTIVGNTASELAGAGIIGDATVTSTILDDNTGESGEANCVGEIESGGHNMVGVSGSECEWEEGVGDQFEKDPQLGSLVDNGGPTLTMAPVSRESLAINRGSQPGAGDQRGLARPVPLGELLTDVGAVEVQAPKVEAPPSISPATNLEVGEQLTCNPGSWNTDTVTEPLVTYAWQRGVTKVGEASTYTPTEADADQTLTCKATVNNGVVPVAASSAAVELESGLAELSPGSLSFGSRNVGAGPSALQNLTLTNVGGADLTVTDVASSDQEQFSVDPTDCLEGGGVLAPGSSCSIPVSFDPETLGPLDAMVEVSSDHGEPTADVTGSGTVPALEVTPASFDFGPRQLGTGASLAKAFKVLNNGTGPTEIDPIAIVGPNPGDFSLVPGGDDCSETVLAPGGLCVVEVRFDPAAAGLREAALALSGEAAANVSLQGTGTNPPTPNPPTPPTPPTPPSPEPEPAAPTLTVKSAKRSGEAIVVTLACRSFQPRCEGQLDLRSTSARRVELAGGTVSVATGIQKVRLRLTHGGYLLLEADPTPMLKAKATALDRTYDRKTVRTKRLRLSR